MADDDFYETTWGSIRLWCSRVHTAGGRTQVIHRIGAGDVHPVSDRGLEPKVCTVALLFDDIPGESLTPLERLRQFKDQIARGEDEMFTHPVDGAFLVKAGKFDYVIDEDSNILEASIEFIQSEEIVGVNPAGLGVSGHTGTDALAATSADLLADLEDSDITSDLPTRAVAMQESWLAAEEVPTRDILVDAAAVSAELAALIEDEGLEDDLAKFGAYRSAMLFGAAFRAAALAASSDVPSIFVMKVRAATSLLALVAKIYGGAEADLRERQVRNLNDLRFTGGLIAAGTELVMPSKPNVFRAA